MLIANPSYNVVFKYLLEDENVARLMLTALLGKEVLEVQSRPTHTRREARIPEGDVERPDGAPFLALRMDFLATVRLEDGGSQPVLVEIRKALSVSDMQRFRRYLGSSYASPDNVYLDADGRQRALPIVTIYFLGEDLECVEVPVLDLNQHFLEVATGEEVWISEPFVEASPHRAMVVQINRLKNRRRTELERWLVVFDQGLVAPSNPHVLEILEEDCPERQREVLRRLLRAGAEREVLEGMEVEDEWRATFKDQGRDGGDLGQAPGDKGGLIPGLKGCLSRA